jgi:putative nucleotidyltransferase with HDIG domain
MSFAAVIICIVTLLLVLLSGWLTRRAMKKAGGDEYSLMLRPAAWEKEGGTDLTAPMVVKPPPSPEEEDLLPPEVDLPESDEPIPAPLPKIPRTAPRLVPTGDDLPNLTTVIAPAPSIVPTPAGARLRPTSLDDDAGTPRLMDEVLGGLQKIPPLPQSVLLILKELEAAGSSAKSVGDILSTDPAIGAALLRVVNSASMGLRRRVLSVHNAVSYLGFTNVRGIVLRLKLADFLPQPKSKRQCYDTGALWLHSAAVSAVADVLAKRIGHNPRLRIDPALASTLGLLHDIGKLAINSQFPDKVAALWGPQREGPGDESLLARERRLFGADHAFMGGFLAARWKLPDELADAIRLHHLPAGDTLDNLPPDLRRAVVVVHVANQLVKYEHVYCEDMEIDIVPAALLALLDLPTTFEELLDGPVRVAIQQSTAIARELNLQPTKPQRLSA